MDSATAFVMALLALIVAAAGFVFSVLTFIHSRRRDFPTAKLVVSWRKQDQGVAAHVRSVGAGVATRIESWVWNPKNGKWHNLGPWRTDMPTGAEYSIWTFESEAPDKRVKMVWYDESRPDMRREVTSQWKMQD